MTRRRTRRRYLVAGGTLGLAAIGGCLDQGDEGPGADTETEESAHEDEEDEENGEEDDAGEAAEDVDHENPDGEVSFVEPEDGDEIESPVEIEAEVEGFDLQPADEQVLDGEGHLHVLVDVDCVEPGEAIPFEEGYHHLEDGEEETELDLEPGEYDLCLQASDAAHVAYDLTDEITIEVDESGEDDG